MTSIAVRRVRSEDLPALLTWRNHPFVRNFMLSRHEIQGDEHRAWFAKNSTDISQRLLIIEEDHIPLGFAQFSGVTEGGISDWGFYARPDAPKGVGTKLGVVVLEHAFRELRLHKVCGQAISSNIASIALHGKLGFSEEGVLREQRRIEGAYHSLVCFGLLENEWRTQRDAVGK